MCNFPRKGFILGKKDNGKKDIYITSFKVDHMELCDGKWEPSYHYELSKRAEKICRDYVEIKCGKCLQCKLDRSKQWADRLMLEALDYEYNWFTTFTYDDDHVPVVEYVNKNGEVKELKTLRYKDFQDFMKRLRKKFPDIKIKYLCCGEYGETTLRPHYHAIIFNLKLDDIKPTGEVNFRNELYYESKTLTDLWSNGFVILGKCDWNSAAYCVNYTIKNQFTNFEFEEYGLEKPKLKCSQGLAKNQYELNKDIFIEYGSMYLSTSNGSKKITTSRYFDNHFLDENELEMLQSKRKEYASYSQSLLESQTDHNIEEIRRIRNDSLVQRTKALKRDL